MARNQICHQLLSSLPWLFVAGLKPSCVFASALSRVRYTGIMCKNALLHDHVSKKDTFLPAASRRSFYQEILQGERAKGNARKRRPFDSFRLHNSALMNFFAFSIIRLVQQVALQLESVISELHFFSLIPKCIFRTFSSRLS